ncbi:Similar to phosphoglycolate phosphatase, clustered with ubiquinone biosynthesis SAM-dependent O-methyltransferase [uncultured Candidatus Thioglobus sp.]|nr:Similar to phosphoglycolate phosphatase, clustered with ubiquinone biosynthesis SAM-dependent O-methyltransferase [uncultured Candidatus Thioglobus sp.]
MISSVFFDLDGTLADTAPDLTTGLNQILQKEKKLSLSIKKVKPFISRGSNAMIQMAFDIYEEDPKFQNLKKSFLTAYKKTRYHQTQVFLGIEQVLQYLEAKNIIWGVITNKPAEFTEPIMQKLNLTQQAACIISGDTTPFKKPSPQPILYACNITKTDPKKAVYIGDAEIDMQAGQAIGMKTLIANYGYLSENDKPKQWGADGTISQPEKIIDWIKKENNTCY